MHDHHSTAHRAHGKAIALDELLVLRLLKFNAAAGAHVILEFADAHKVVLGAGDAVALEKVCGNGLLQGLAAGDETGKVLAQGTGALFESLDELGLLGLELGLNGGSLTIEALETLKLGLGLLLVEIDLLKALGQTVKLGLIALSETEVIGSLAVALDFLDTGAQRAAATVVVLDLDAGVLEQAHNLRGLLGKLLEPSANLLDLLCL